ncbi:hypothetical protein BO71DRAFT_251609 [Aspergillus ellipticus CBS 707.79]|uniref:Uncharacterized protein n=1 Tax=Aspergillus ellipticus CBS 707.79 TaxID=1448320 RepID=A0A319D8R3_9EURO|nr:hypothetical protein BO71DRAFT_251609 [Aspergillus ellipticus CBS 707.79]
MARRGDRKLWVWLEAWTAGFHRGELSSCLYVNDFPPIGYAGSTLPRLLRGRGRKAGAECPMTGSIGDRTRHRSAHPSILKFGGGGGGGGDHEQSIDGRREAGRPSQSVATRWTHWMDEWKVPQTPSERTSIDEPKGVGSLDPRRPRKFDIPSPEARHHHHHHHHRRGKIRLKPTALNIPKDELVNEFNNGNLITFIAYYQPRYGVQ